MKGFPDKAHYHPYFDTYISQVKGDDIKVHLEDGGPIEFYKNINHDKWDYRYAPDKWTVKEVLMHIMDTERIFAYRALRISRGDKTALAGFDQNPYVASYFPDSRTPSSLLEEYRAMRNNTIELFKNFMNSHYQQVGVASEHAVSVHALAYMIVGHELHHLNLFKERYDI